MQYLSLTVNFLKPYSISIMKNNRLLAIFISVVFGNTCHVFAQTPLSNYAPVATGLNSINNGERNTLLRLGVPLGILGQVLVTGSDNVFTGYNAGGILDITATGNSNSYYGSRAGQSNLTGSENTFVGASAGMSANGGRANTFMGSRAGFSVTTASFNTFIGSQAGYYTTTGGSNFMMGTNAGLNNISGTGNFFMGDNSAGQNTTGSFNLYIGANVANGDGVNGDNNVSLGYESGRGNKYGVNNTFVGFRADAGASSLSNATAIGNNAKVTASNSLILGDGANVGIGNTAPKAKLEITTGSAGVSGLRFTNLTNSTGASLTGQTKFLTVDTDGNVVMGSTTSSGRVAATESFWEKNTNGFLQTADQSSGVVIGKGLVNRPAGYQLYVADGILTEKVKVAVKNSADWSDYVFAPTYTLRPLEDVEQFVKTNKHLPGVPSATEVVESGIDVAKMDAKLLEKIEELTLYMIEMKKENERKIQQLESENKELRRMILK